ncbi:hypothetical protein ACFE04_003056 [Oxalis oulophora]
MRKFQDIDVAVLAAEPSGRYLACCSSKEPDDAIKRLFIKLRRKDTDEDSPLFTPPIATLYLLYKNTRNPLVSATKTMNMAHQEDNLRRGPWLEEEDERLISFVTILGERKWDYLASMSGLRRSGKSCRLRWLNYLRPNVKRGHISAEEDQIILQLHKLWGNKWSKIAQRLPGRTDNEIKNYWRSHLRKKVEAQEQGNGNSNLLNSISFELFNQRVDTKIQKYETEDRFVNNILNSGNAPVDNLPLLADYDFTSSPYETRISDWISELSSSDQNEEQHYEDCNNVDSSFCYPDETWDCAASLWNMD